MNQEKSAISFQKNLQESQRQLQDEIIYRVHNLCIWEKQINSETDFEVWERVFQAEINQLWKVADVVYEIKELLDSDTQ